MKRPVQYFSHEYLEYCKTLSTKQILQFLEDFKQLHLGVKTQSTKTKLISIKIPEDLLNVFKMKAENQGMKYQTQIKKLMQEWIESK